MSPMEGTTFDQTIYENFIVLMLCKNKHVVVLFSV